MVGFHLACLGHRYRAVAGSNPALPTTFCPDNWETVYILRTAHAHVQALFTEADKINQKLGIQNFIDIWKRNYAILCVLFGSLLVSASSGLWSNWDAETEFTAASAILSTGLPYATPGNIINQPPLAFYITAAFLKIFGSSYGTGVAVTTLFGVGCVFLLYKVGKEFYGQRTGLLAAAIFALSPWQVVISRSFLIDAQCLFFSMLSLLVGIYAARKNSLKLLLLSGLLFGVAFLTKAFAVFMLIPLVLIYVRYKRKNLKTLLGGVTFLVPFLVFSYLWYEVITKLGLFNILGHGDFSILIPVDLVPSPFYLGNFLLSHVALGLLFSVAIAASLLITLSNKRIFAKFAASDLICLLTIALVLGLNIYMVLGMKLMVPFADPAKYVFSLLPFFSLLAASLLPKSYLLYSSSSIESRRRKISPYATFRAATALLVTSVFVNFCTLVTLSRTDFMVFKVQGEVGFSFSNLASLKIFDHGSLIQSLGLVITLSSLLFVNKTELKLLFKKSTQKA
jgi:4-amino-4-deoxy-L-arabinose transferase-like glycosyltransferase